MPLSSGVISDWKDKTISLILDNKDIIECLELDEAEQEDPIYNRIFPYHHIPQTVEEAKVYITIAAGVSQIKLNKIWMYPKLSIRVISHQGKMKLAKAGVSATRIDYISKLIIKMLIGRPNFGYGKLQLTTDEEDMYNNVYHYRELVFTSEELVKTNCED